MADHPVIAFLVFTVTLCVVGALLLLASFAVFRNLTDVSGGVDGIACGLIGIVAGSVAEYFLVERR